MVVKKLKINKYSQTTLKPKFNINKQLKMNP